jgi:hypothetical protein
LAADGLRALPEPYTTACPLHGAIEALAQRAGIRMADA